MVKKKEIDKIDWIDKTNIACRSIAREEKRPNEQNDWLEINSSRQKRWGFLRFKLKSVLKRRFLAFMIKSNIVKKDKFFVTNELYYTITFKKIIIRKGIIEMVRK